MNSEFRKSVCLILENYYKINKKIPYFKDLLNDSSYWPIVSTLSQEEKQFVNYVIQDFFIETIEWGKWTKGKKILAELYKRNKKDCNKFRELCEDRENIKKEEFHTIWEKLRKEIQNGEDLLSSSQENSKFKKFSSSTNESFKKLIKGFFPLYEQIGVKILTK